MDVNSNCNSFVRSIHNNNDNNKNNNNNNNNNGDNKNNNNNNNGNFHSYILKYIQSRIISITKLCSKLSITGH